MFSKNRPVRLEKQESVSMRKTLTHKRTFRVANWLILALMLLLFIGVCLLIVPQTHGFFWY
ncbi:MAG: hypothetical protein IJH65_12080 [Methanobrevibacter sp.]|nr:hypothetical protein [Methanobrevibacter sp.]